MTGLSKPELFLQSAITSIDANPASPLSVREATPLLDRLMADDVKQYWTVIQSVSFPGKPGPKTANGLNGTHIYAEYQLPYCKTNTVSNPSLNVCDVTGTSSETKGYLELQVDQTVERHFAMSIDDFNNVVETPNQRLANLIRRQIFDMKHELNKKTITRLAALIGDYPNGNFSGGANAETVTVIDTNGNIVPLAYAKIREAYRKAFYQGDLLIFGGETLATYFDLRLLAGLNQNNQLANPGQILSMMPIIYDNNLDPTLQTILGGTASHGLSIPKSGFFIYEHYENTGSRQLNEAFRQSTTLDVDGFQVDYDLKFDDCEKVWMVQLKKHAAFGSIPAAAYCNGQGLTFNWKFAAGTVNANTPFLGPNVP